MIGVQNELKKLQDELNAQKMAKPATKITAATSSAPYAALSTTWKAFDSTTCTTGKGVVLGRITITNSSSSSVQTIISLAADSNNTTSYTSQAVNIAAGTTQTFLLWAEAEISTDMIYLLARTSASASSITATYAGILVFSTK